MSLRIVSGKYKGRVLQTPSSISTRPTQESLREAVFNICQMLVVDARFLDLFAGSGAMGLESLSREASHVTFVEKDKRAITCIQNNIEKLGVKEKTSILCLDATKSLKHLGDPFDLIYIDPPYDIPVKPIVERVLEQGLLKKDGVLFVERLYIPKKDPLIVQGAHLTSTRRFGKAELLEYRAV